MAGSIVQSGYAVDDSGTNATTIGVTLTGVVAGNTIAVHVGWGTQGIGITATVSDGTSYGVADAERDDTSDNQGGEVFYLENVSGGSHTITATFSQTCAFRRIRAYELSGLQTSSSLDKSTGQWNNLVGNGTDAVTSGNTAATANANDFLLGLTQNCSEADPGSGTIAAGTSFTLSGANQILSGESRSVSATGTYAGTFTQPSGSRQYVTHVVIFKEASAAGNVPYDIMHHQYQALLAQ